MKSQQVNKRLIVTLVLVYCYQHTTHAVASPAENVTELLQPSNRTLDIKQKENVVNEITTIEATTNEAEMDITTLPLDFEVDGRHAFINNQFVAEDEESLTSAILPSNNKLQPNFNTNDMHYTASTKLGTQNPPLRLNFATDTLAQDTADYEDEDTSDYAAENDSMAQNSEESQDSLLDKETQIPDVGPNIPASSYSQIKPSNPSYYKMHTNANLGGSYYNNNFIQNSNMNPGILYALKPTMKPLKESNKKQLENTATQRIYSNTENLRNEYDLNERLSISNSTTEPLNLSMPNFSLHNSNMQTTSPFSTTSGGLNKKFKTVSSSVQYVSTPLADLVFKYSIGMAKHMKSKPNENISKITYYISGKTE